MQHIEDSKRICLERDARHCRHCGTTKDIGVYQLNKREGNLAWQLSNLITLCEKCHGEAEDSRNRESNKVGVLLCGGRGTRLYPLTYFSNKHALPIGNVPGIFYPLRTLRKFGAGRVLVVLDRDSAGEITKMLGSGKEFGMDISYKIQEGAGGISEALYLAKDFVREDEEIICILGDNIFDNDEIVTNIDLKQENAEACVFLKQVENPEQYGVAKFNKDRTIEKIVEKPKEFVSNMAVVGLYMYTPGVFDVIEKIKPSDRGELEISDVNDYYAQKGTLHARSVFGYWGDAGGSIKRYAECNMHGVKKANVSADEIDSYRAIVFDDK